MLSPLGQLSNNRRKRKNPPLRAATFSDFSGGLNAVDNELTMKSRYAVQLDNLIRAGDGSRSIRYGTQYFVNVSSEVSGDIIEIAYFADYLLAFTDDGEIAKIAADGTVTAIWNETIANALPGTPSGWSTGLTAIDTTEFRGELVCMNGTDKPILIADDLTVTYLQDLATSSNTNTPTGKYVTTVRTYCVVAGVTGAEGDIYISNAGTSGTWYGDAGSDGIVFNVSSFAPETDGIIIGLSSFRNTLFVHFDNVTVALTLGTYDDTPTHTPLPVDTLTELSIINHRCVTATPKTLLCVDTGTVSRIVRNQFGTFDPVEMSGNISPDYKNSIPFDADDRATCFAVHSPLDNRLIVFVPSADGIQGWATQIEDRTNGSNEWEHFTGWDWTCGCTSRKGRIYFCKGTKVYQYGNNAFNGEEYHADFINDTDGDWVTSHAYVVGDLVTQSGTSYECLVNHTSGTFATDLAAEKWAEYEGAAIEFVWETPWATAGLRQLKKQLQYLSMDTTGFATFTIEVYVDNIRTDADGNDDPEASMAFVAGSSQGFGGTGSQPYGGGRRTADERFWKIPVDFKIMKHKFYGSSREALNIISINWLYQLGTYKRG